MGIYVDYFSFDGYLDPKLGIMAMHLLGRDKLEPLKGLDGGLDKWVVSWVSEMTQASWKGSTDLLAQFPKAQEIAPGVFRFYVVTGNYAVEVRVAFPQGIALITALLTIEESNGH
ncbi:TPA: type II toxin-antitoxin system HigB family toxin [Pseudomonas aeruginosa]|uniref:type II toxin-antitoxin system HigB family toxin n=1 Tax=Pseudomonas aeruginosa TaxID=287 RepID=UPI001298739C|nr:type II toxin-antitoxin system HigB family toxin [Pseudomonas aeruginosa]EIU3807851.1 type II toxin-antitoxin system HigB family toxin [Pseudomonas aeruginosa]EIU3910664.1 type II toxin-antitoxin system HigB family toxin [Pseudomonas aeruginosa]EIU3972046.1 type II toxin-antitoxin system HigB family toxin [Pseudomonas aeruginosa]WGW30465.1 type II toxin-antitoxin system HigB family toxin [Pseudomonas aeruginosa]WGW42980.1 type II toxin-antitoxin system HigB family toxin [Pseudomonas aerugin